MAKQAAGTKGSRASESSRGNENERASETRHGNDGRSASKQLRGNESSSASDGPSGNDRTGASDHQSGNERSRASRLGLRELADLYEATLRVRNACGNRLGAVERAADEDPGAPSEVANYPLLDRLNDALEQSRKDMEAVLPEHPCYEWLMGVPGINRTLGCRVLGMIPMGGPEDFVTFSQFRVFCGLCPGRNRPVKGEKSCYSRRLKTALYVAFGNMLKAEAVMLGKPWAPKFYADIYRWWRGIYRERHGEGKSAKEAGWPDLRQHYAAKNKLLDVFCCHLWRVWREKMGWPIRSLYVHEVLGHHMDYDADEFSSAALAKRKGVKR